MPPRAVPPDLNRLPIPMNAIRPRILMLVAGLLLSGASARGDEEPAAEPLELTRLRQQFQHRLDQELEP